jgi:hypothetical protein
MLKKTLGWLPLSSKWLIENFQKKRNIDSSWIKKSKFVQLYNIDVTEDPVRPQLNLTWRTSFGRKIFGLQHNDEILAVVCLAFTDDVPRSVRELDLMCRVVSTFEDSANIAVAYTVWSNRKGAGKRIMQKVLEYAKTKGLERVVTLSPLTPVATHYHIRNGARLISLNETTQNFEYSLCPTTVKTLTDKRGL